MNDYLVLNNQGFSSVVWITLKWKTSQKPCEISCLHHMSVASSSDRLVSPGGSAALSVSESCGSSPHSQHVSVISSRSLCLCFCVSDPKPSDYCLSLLCNCILMLCNSNFCNFAFHLNLLFSFIWNKFNFVLCHCNRHKQFNSSPNTNDLYIWVQSFHTLQNYCNRGGNTMIKYMNYVSIFVATVWKCLVSSKEGGVPVLLSI